MKSAFLRASRAHLEAAEVGAVPGTKKAPTVLARSSGDSIHEESAARGTPSNWVSREPGGSVVTLPIAASGCIPQTVVGRVSGKRGGTARGLPRRPGDSIFQSGPTRMEYKDGYKRAGSALF